MTRSTSGRAAVAIAALALAAAVAGCGSAPQTGTGYAATQTTSPSASSSGTQLTATCQAATMQNGDPGYSITFTNPASTPLSVYNWTVALISNAQQVASSSPGPFADIGVAAGNSMTLDIDTYTSTGTTGSIWDGGMSCSVVSLDQTLPG